MQEIIKLMKKTYNGGCFTISYSEIDLMWYAGYCSSDFCFVMSNNGRDIYQVGKTPYIAVKKLYNQFKKGLY